MKKLNNEGFTLVEVIVTIAIMSIVFMAIFSVLEFSQNSFTYGEEQVDINAELRYSALRITQEVRNSFKSDFSSNMDYSVYQGASATLGTFASNRPSSIYLDGNQIAFEQNGSVTYLTSDIITDLYFRPEQNSTTGKVHVVVFIEAGDNEVETSVLLNNVDLVDGALVSGADLDSGKLDGDYGKIWFSKDVGLRD